MPAGGQHWRRRQPVRLPGEVSKIIFAAVQRHLARPCMSKADYRSQHRWRICKSALCFLFWGTIANATRLFSGGATFPCAHNSRAGHHAGAVGQALHTAGFANCSRLKFFNCSCPPGGTELQGAHDSGAGHHAGALWASRGGARAHTPRGPALQPRARLLVSLNLWFDRAAQSSSVQTSGTHAHVPCSASRNCSLLSFT